MPPQELFATKMSNSVGKISFHIKLLKIGFVANDNWRQAPGFGMLHHIFLDVTHSLQIPGKLAPIDQLKKKAEFSKLLPRLKG